MKTPASGLICDLAWSVGRVVLCAAAFLIFAAGDARADCAMNSGPPKPEGFMFYNTDEGVFQTCLNSEWVQTKGIGYGKECPGGYILDEDRCYKFSNKVASFGDAYYACQAEGASLVTINDSDEQNFISANVLQTLDWRYWLGYNDAQNEGTWVWLDPSSSYTSWDAGQPDGGTGEACGAIAHDSNNDFIDANCDDLNLYICEMPSKRDDCSNFGDFCADDTVYIGPNPVSVEKMYTTPCDLGRTWDGSKCSGEPLRLPWDDGSGAGETTNITVEYDFIDGHFNTAVLSEMDADGGTGGVQHHAAAKACRDLTAHGHSDWYLPAAGELILFGYFHSQINDVDRTGYPWALYWVSNEWDLYTAGAWSFKSSEIDNLTGTNKDYNTSGLTRCIRRPSATSSEVAPTGCGTIGNTCSDGTRYAGNHPLISGVKMYVWTADQGTALNWWSGLNSLIGSSPFNGVSNHDLMKFYVRENPGNNISDFQSMAACEDLAEGGHTDWYLPSVYELEVLYNNRAALGISTSIYWSSTQMDDDYGHWIDFSDGSIGNDNVAVDYRVRCIRKDNFD